MWVSRNKLEVDAFMSATATVSSSKIEHSCSSLGQLVL